MTRVPGPSETENSRTAGDRPIHLEAEGFVFEDDRWIEQIRRAESSVALGSIGEYELLAEIGRGAQGIVYKAVQPHTKRPIAIKRLVGGSLAGAEMRARLVREVEAAAALDHPSIVTVYGMELIDGQPVLAMEWVDGRPVDAWSDGVGRDGEGVRSQLTLFQAICAGIEHAHERGIIHRDIKPTNILINADGRPRILDFGLAKFAGPDGHSSDLTVTGGFIGTPAYAAPERLAGLRGISEIRSDVYSLGAVLYRMLTGRLPRPVDVPLAKFLETRWQDPLRPSSINPALNDELDAILLTALAEEPDRRYASVAQFAEDISRFMEGLPIAAAPQSLSYRIVKSVRRHRAAFGALALIALILIAATAVSAAMAVQASRARERADERTRVAEFINAFLTNDLLAAVDPQNTDNPDLTVREVLDRAAANIENQFEEEPLVEASIRRAIGATYRALGLPREAIPQLSMASELYSETLGAGHAESRLAKRDLVSALFDGSRKEDAKPLAEALFKLDVAFAGDPSADAMATRHLLAQLSADFDERTAMFQEVLDWRRKNLGDRHPETLSVLQTLSNEYLYNNHLAKAEPLIMEIWETVQVVYAESHPQRLKAMSLASTLYGKLGRDEEALEVLRESVRIHKETKPEYFFGTGIMLGHLGQCLEKLQRYEEARDAYLEGYAILSQSLGPEGGWTQGVARLLGNLYERMGDPEQAAIWRDKLLPQYR